MKYKVFGGNLPAVTLSFEQGESIYTQSGGMTWMTDGFSMETNMRGGFMKSLGRMLAGESLFMATYTAAAPGQEMTIASTFPGELLSLTLDGTMEYICQKQSFLCATQNVTLSMATQLNKGGLFGGEGFILQRLSGTGMAFLELDGTVVEKTLAPGERLKVSTGNVALYEATVKYSAETVKGFKNIVFGGEGLFLTVLEGPGKVWLQTITMPSFADKLIPFIPIKNN
jgi:uncharacterized protein (TIGR00266 family)